MPKLAQTGEHQTRIQLVLSLILTEGNFELNWIEIFFVNFFPIPFVSLYFQHFQLCAVTKKSIIIQLVGNFHKWAIKLWNFFSYQLWKKGLPAWNNITTELQKPRIVYNKNDSCEISVSFNWFFQPLNLCCVNGIRGVVHSPTKDKHIYFLSSSQEKFCPKYACAIFTTRITHHDCSIAVHEFTYIFSLTFVLRRFQTVTTCSVTLCIITCMRWSNKQNVTNYIILLILRNCSHKIYWLLLTFVYPHVFGACCVDVLM